MSMINSTEVDTLSGLKQFCGRPEKPLKSKPATAVGFRSLPFVAGPRSKVSAPFWNVPATGGYMGGYEAGAGMALTLLKTCRDPERNQAADFILTQIVESFMIRFEEEGGLEVRVRKVSDWGEEFESFRGQYVGFFNTLSKWLAAAAKTVGSDLDGLSDSWLLDQANAGLGFQQSRYVESLA